MLSNLIYSGAEFLFTRMQRDFQRLPVHENFSIYWNVPTFVCQKYGIDFSEHTSKYGIISNQHDAFRGDYVQIMYDPGNFPALLRVSLLFFFCTVHFP